ncbi:MAG: nitrous oxide reductase accessory protein NosL [Halorientalis sp.]
MLGAVGGGITLALSGCSHLGLGDESTTEAPNAVTLTEQDACDVCGMIIPNHPGPSAEIFYPDHKPSGHENPAHFDSTWEAFKYDFDRQDRGWNRSVMYVTDYSSVDYKLHSEQGDTLISNHPKASAFVSADAVTFVAGSEVKGAMGKDLIAFSKQGDAKSFKTDHGGQLVMTEDVTPELIAQLGT